ncbi:vesicle-associated protein 2-2 isoform X2 [Carica papaya]|uniref:vesicle-associated protein 2-2 isoform X2 n=1 Tax=Carica papaya TaxID=3649 RepID=UPI000B8C937C|nr:vesicle-associated protein 2-2 isoform X2 [Carica papaya]
MSTQLLEIQPRELKFIFELKKQSSCSIQLTNNTDQFVAFKVKTTAPKKYCVRPNVGVVAPKASSDFTVTMQAQREAPPDMMCRDKFLIQSTVVPVGTSDEDITASMFAKDDGRYVEENKLKVVLVSPPHSPPLSPVKGTLKQGPIYEASDIKILEPKKVNFEDLMPKRTAFNHEELNPMRDADLKVKKDGINGEDLKPVNATEFKSTKDGVDTKELKLAKDTDFKPSNHVGTETAKSLGELRLIKEIDEMKSKLNELKSKLDKAEATISTLTEERKSIVQERKTLQEELALLRSKTTVKQVHVGFPLLYVVMVAFISIILGYYLHC